MVKGGVHTIVVFCGFDRDVAQLFSESVPSTHCKEQTNSSIDLLQQIPSCQMTLI